MISAVLLETLCCHEALRRCGFDAGDIFVQLAASADTSQALMDRDAPIGTLFVHVTLRAQCREFTIAVGRWDDTGTSTEKIFASAWRKAVTWFNTSPQSEVQPIWDASKISHQLVKLVTALTIKGFTVPSFGAAAPTRATSDLN